MISNYDTNDYHARMLHVCQEPYGSISVMSPR